MANMLDQKNKIAYDKGRLQSKVDQFQTELENLTGVQAEVMSLKKGIEISEGMHLDNPHLGIL